MDVEWAGHPIDWHGLSKADYVRMKNDYMTYWRPVLTKRSQRDTLKEIVRWQNYMTGASFRSHECIARSIGMATKTVERAVSDLEKLGVIEVHRLRAAPRRPDGLLVTPRKGGRSNHYWVDYNAVRIPVDGPGGWIVSTDTERGVLAMALQRARSSGSAVPEQVTSSSLQRLSNGMNATNAFNEVNATNTTNLVVEGARRRTESPRLQPRLAVNAETPLEKIDAMYPLSHERHPVEDWSLKAASVLALWSARRSPTLEPVQIERVARRLWEAEGRVGRAAAHRACSNWVADRREDDTMHSPGALFLRDLQQYLDDALDELDPSAQSGPEMAAIP